MDERVLMSPLERLMRWCTYLSLSELGLNPKPGDGQARTLVDESS